MLVFRNASDWAQYRAASVHGGGDLVQALKQVAPLLKLHVLLGATHSTDAIKTKDYKSFGPLHKFTLSDGENVLGMFAARGSAGLFELRNAINQSITNARGGGQRRSSPGGAVGRYAA